MSRPFKSAASTSAVKSPVSAVSSVACALAGGGSSPAAPFVTSTTAGTLRNDYTGWVGMKFTTGAQALTVTELGRYVVAGNSQPHTVKIVRASDNAQLATATVQTAGAPAGQYKYAALPAPVTLSANTVYYLVSQETAGGDQWCDANTSVVTSPVGSVNSATWGDLTNWYFTGGAGSTFVPANFKYTEGGGGEAARQRPPCGGSSLTSWARHGWS